MTQTYLPREDCETREQKQELKLTAAAELFAVCYARNVTRRDQNALFSTLVHCKWWNADVNKDVIGWLPATSGLNASRRSHVPEGKHDWI